jgi:hypothetical protein
MMGHAELVPRLPWRTLMMSHWKSSVVLLLCAQLVGCKDDPKGNDEDSTSGPGPTSETEGPTSMTLDPETTAPIDPTTESSESSIGPVTETETDPTTTSPTETESESETETTGGPLACVNEDLGSAVGSSVLSGSTTGDDTDLANSCLEGGKKKGGPAPDYIVSWTAPAAGDYTFSLVGSEYDTAIAIFDGDCNGPELACNDDCEDLQSVLGLTVEADQVVLIAISGYGGRAGNFDLGITAEVAPECGGFETETDSATATVSVTDTDGSTDPTTASDDDASTVTVGDDGG